MTHDALLATIEAERELMIAVATGGPKINDVNARYKEQRTQILSELGRLGIEHPNRFEDLWEWYGKWSSGDLPTYRSRRDYLAELYRPLLERLRSPAEVEEPSPPTGWLRVDRGVDAMRDQLASASAEEDYQTVGLRCREVLISLAQAVFDPRLHKTLDGVAASSTDAKRMLEAYIATELSGGSNETARKHARAALDLANELQHRRTATFRTAALCAEATSAVVNSVAIISGRRDPGSKGLTKQRVKPARRASPIVSVGPEPLHSRLDRILALRRATWQIVGGRFSRTVGGVKQTFALPTRQGEFTLYSVANDENIQVFWYLAQVVLAPDIDRLLADVRVLMDGCSQGQNSNCVFIIATNGELRDQESRIIAGFERMKEFIGEDQRPLFTLEVWDAPRLLSIERELGIRVPS